MSSGASGILNAMYVEIHIFLRLRKARGGALSVLIFNIVRNVRVRSSSREIHGSVSYFRPQLADRVSSDAVAVGHGFDSHQEAKNFIS